MKKLKSLLTLGAAAMLLVGCGEQAGKSAEAPESKEPSSAQVENSNAVSSNKSSTPVPTSSTPSSAAPKSTTIPSTVTVTKKDKPYTIFNTVPEIKFVTTEGADMTWATQYGKGQDKPEVSGWITTSSYDGVEGFKNDPGKMKVRGNYTSNYQKKPMRIKFDTKRNLFGLNKGNKYKKWVLLADVKDTAMVRNAAAFYLARHLMPSTVFVPDFTPVHLYLNDQYWGLYTLTEQKEVGKGRVDIKAPAADYAGTDIGYFFELDNYYTEEAAKGEEGDPTFEVNYKPASINWYHKFENYNHIQKGYTIASDITNRTTQVPYIQKRVEMAYQVIYDAVMNNKFTRIENEQIVNDGSATLEECLAKTIDIDSFVGMYLLHDIVCDPDIGYSSFYLSLDMSSTGNHLLTLNNPWDFDSAFGIRKPGDAMQGQGSQEGRDIKAGTGPYAEKSSNMWLSLMAKAPFFREKVTAKYKELYDANVFQQVNDMIDDYSSTYSAGYVKNYQKWPRTMGNNPETNFEVVDEIKNFTNQTQCKNFLKSWFNARVSYLNSVHIEGAGGGGSGHETPDKDQFKANAVKTRLEAENSTLTNGSGANTIQVKTKENEGISGNSYVGNMDGNNGASCTWTFLNTANTAKKIYVVAGLSARTTDRTFAQMFTLTINGVAVDPENITIPAGNGQDYHMWTTVDVGFSNVNPGENEVVLTSTGSCTNFDYLDFYIEK